MRLDGPDSFEEEANDMMNRTAKANAVGVLAGALSGALGAWSTYGFVMSEATEGGVLVLAVALVSATFVGVAAFSTVAGLVAMFALQLQGGFFGGSE